jgi:hypothetical protein
LHLISDAVKETKTAYEEMPAVQTPMPPPTLASLKELLDLRDSMKMHLKVTRKQLTAILEIEALLKEASVTSRRRERA